MYYIFFTFSSVDRHLGCFHTLEIVNNATMHIGVYVSFQSSIFAFFRYVSGVELLGHVVVLVSFFFFFLENPIPFSTVAAPIYIPSNSDDGFLFSTSLPTFVVYILFGDSHFDRCQSY